MPKNKQKKVAIFTLISFLLPIFAQAAEADINYIIADEEVENYQTMDQKDIQAFLDTQNSYLADYSYSGDNPSPAQLALDPDKKYYKTRDAAEIIYNAAQEWHINPQFLLTMMEKEMSLISDQTPTENQLAYAMGYNCPDSGGCAFKTKGFGKQVRAAAEQFRWFIDHIYEYNWQPNKPACADDPNPFLPCTTKGTVVTPANTITAAMYLYTPHVHGNTLFATLWSQFGFAGEGTTPPVITVTGIFPDGALVKAKDSEDGAIYLIVNGAKRPFASMTALVSRYDPNKVLNVAGEELEKYNTGYLIDFSNYSVVQSPAGNKYLIDGLTKRAISSDEAFRQLGFNPAEVEAVTDAQLANYTDGAELTADSSPFAELWQDMVTDGVYYVKDGQKHRIIDQEILVANYPDMAVKEVTTKTLEDITTGLPIKLVDGTLVKKEFDKDIYVISDGYRRLIPNGETFEKLGYDWTAVRVISNKVMNFHKIGEPLISQL